MSNPWSQIKEAGSAPVGGPAIALPRESRAKTLRDKVFSAIGIIAVIFLVGWGIIKAIPGLSSGMAAVITSLSSNFSTGGEKVAVSGPSSVMSGETFSLSWTEKDPSSGSYTISYDCREGAYLRFGAQAVYCNTATPLPIQTNNVSLTAWANTTTDLTIYIRKTMSNDSVVMGAKNITIQTSGTRDPNQTTGSVLGTSTTATSTPNDNEGGNNQGTIIPIPGTPDLIVRIVSTGVVNKATNAYTPKSIVNRNERAAIRFEIQNIGTAPSGTWKFNAILPTNPSHTVVSESQVSLFPNDRVQFTLGFDSIVDQTNAAVTVIADSQNSVNELSEINNTAQAIIEINR